ncbi:importin-13-like [Antedon mediterranea]|uniref:importin-13-like n=1 Tax=Antedon mediterranea TaxID=105859 RepID=UPI003AF89F37
MAFQAEQETDSALDLTVENIEKALHQLYFDPDPSVKSRAQNWLFTAQRSPQAWQFAWSLLSSDKAAEVQYFGASALYMKITRYWSEVHPEQYANLRTQLFQQIFNFSSVTRIVLTRLCVTLASFSLNTMPEFWSDAVKSMIETFHQAEMPQMDATNKCLALLELLTVLPEEFQTAPLGQTRKGTVRHELQKGLQHVLPLIQNLLDQQDSPVSIRHQALRCFSSWVNFGVPLIDINPFIDILFKYVHDDNLYDTCIDSLISVIQEPSAYKYPNTIKKIIPQVLRLQDLLANAVREKDMDLVHGICRLTVAIGENHSKLILESQGDERQQCLDLTNLILGFTALPGHYPVDENISNMPFGFWYILQDEITGAETVKCQEYLMTFGPIYMHLVDVMLTKVQYPSEDEYNTWNTEEKEQFRCYRQDIGDTLMYCFTLLRQPLLNNLYGMLVRVQSQGGSWQQLEALLFAFRSIAEVGEYGDDECVDNLIRLLPQINMSNVTLATTALYMLEAYSEWLADMPDALDCVIPLVLSGLNNPDLSVPATMSLKEITRECALDMKPHADRILTSIQAALNSNLLKSRECVRLMASVGFVLSTLSVQEILHYLDVIVTPHLQHLEAASHEQPSAASKGTILVKVNMLASLSATLDIRREDKENQGLGSAVTSSQDPQPVSFLLQRVFPILQKVLEVWVCDLGIVQSICEFLKRAITTLLDDVGPMVPGICELLVQIYTASPHVPILDLSQQMLMLFSLNEAYSANTQSLILQLTNKTLSLFQSGNIREHTEVIEAYMNMCTKILKTQPNILISNDMSPSAIFQCGLVSITLPEQPTVKATCNFFNIFIAQSNKVPMYAQTVTQQGQALLELLIKAISGAAPRSLVEPMSDVIFSYSKNCNSHFTTIMPEVIMSHTLELPRANKVQREQFAKSLMRERANKRQFRDIVKEFSLLCRGLLGTEYADF